MQSRCLLEQESLRENKHMARGGGCNQSRICSQRKSLCSLHSGKESFDDSDDLERRSMSFRFWKKKIVEQYVSDNAKDILYKSASDVRWIVFNKLHVENYSKVRHDKVQYGFSSSQLARKHVHLGTDAETAYR
jgi:hypothetical protein